MLKRINWKAVGKAFAWVICLSGMVVLMGFIKSEKQALQCSRIKILIPGADNFIEREEIDIILSQSQGSLVGRPLSTINTQDIEEAIQANPYIAFAKVYADMDGVINIQVKQRQPVLRVINSGGQDYYVDRDGLKMPMSPNFTANVLVATGDILEGFGGRVDTLITPLLDDLYETALFIKQDTLWDAQIEQIFVNNRKEIELIPRVGNQRIILGSAESLSIKMGNLLAFYKQAMPQAGWDTYKSINVKYINQVVCERNFVDSTARKKKVEVVDSSMVLKRNVDTTVKIEAEVKKPMSVDKASELKPNKNVQPAKPATTDPKLANEIKDNKSKESQKPSSVKKEKPADTKNKSAASTKEKTNTKR